MQKYTKYKLQKYMEYKLPKYMEYKLPKSVDVILINKVVPEFTNQNTTETIRNYSGYVKKYGLINDGTPSVILNLNIMYRHGVKNTVYADFFKKLFTKYCPDDVLESLLDILQPQPDILKIHKIKKLCEVYDNVLFDKKNDKNLYNMTYTSHKTTDTIYADIYLIIIQYVHNQIL